VGGLMSNLRRETQTDEHQSTHKSTESSSKHHIKWINDKFDVVKDNTFGAVKDIMERRKTVIDGDDVVADREMEQKTLSTRFVERMWTGKNINSFLNAGDGRKWSMFWMANALNNKSLCEKAWNLMESKNKIQNIFDVLKEPETKDRVIGGNGPLFAGFAHRLQSEVTTANNIKEDQRDLLSTFLREYPVNNVLELDDGKENDNGDEIQSVPSNNNITTMIMKDSVITKESDDQNQMNSNENEIDSVRNEIVEIQSVQLTPKQEAITVIVDDAINGDDQNGLNHNELEYAE